MEFLSGLGFQQVVTCSLNPLRVIMPPVVKNFSVLVRYITDTSFSMYMHLSISAYTSGQAPPARLLRHRHRPQLSHHASCGG